MVSSFSINFPGTPSDFVVNANEAIQTQGGIFQGDQTKGSFSLKTIIGSVKGIYQVLPTDGTQTQVAITITQKPILVPISKIQQVIEGYF